MAVRNKPNVFVCMQGLAILIAVVVVSTVVSFQNYSQQLSFESLQGAF